MGILIHRAEPKDAYEYTVCHAECWYSAYKGIIPDGYLENLRNNVEQRVERMERNIVNQPEQTYCCVKLDIEIIGILAFGKSWDDEKSDAGEVHAIYLLEDYWSKGYGRKMMDYAVGALKSKYCEIIVWVLKENHRARLFYEKYGFSIDGKEKEIVIEKPLIEVRYVLNI